MSAFVGHDVETGDEIRISDTARRSGLYVLGRSGTGKTSLLTNLIEQDTQNGHGLFFLDPHGDAVDTLLARHCYARTEADGTFLLEPTSSVLLLDPMDERYSFGINLLACSDLSSRKARNDAYTRANNVFQKLWQQEWDYRPWLRLILQHTLHAFVENQAYTLADVREFLDPANTAFRNHIVSNIRYNEEVADFWRNQFDAKREADQQQQVDAARGRLRELLGDPYVRDIVGQATTTLDFSDIMAMGRILLVKLPPRLSYDSKRFIGTILINELLQAMYRRDELSPQRRRQFCVFVDEFQRFSALQDFTSLFNEGRKYALATTIAHQERYGQFADNKEIIGATDAAANKVLFALSGEDAKAFAPEFAKEPIATDERYEPLLVITQAPFEELLRGHINSRVRDFVNSYLRPLQDQWDDIPDEINRIKTLRQSLLDKSSLSRLDEQLEALLGRDANLNTRQQALEDAIDALRAANAYTGDILAHYDRSIGARQMKRYLNTFFTGLMEGSISPGQEAFSEFLIGRIYEASRVPGRYRPALAFYIALTYGDASTPRRIPLLLARSNGSFADTAASLVQQAEERTVNDRAIIRKKYLDETLESERHWITITAPDPELKPLALPQASFYIKPVGFKLQPVEFKELWLAPRIYSTYLWLVCYKQLLTLLHPYRTARFGPGSRHLHPKYGTYGYRYEWSDVIHLIGLCCNERNVGMTVGSHYIGTLWFGVNIQAMRYVGFLRPRVVRWLLNFLRTYGESGFCMLALVDAAQRGGWSRNRTDNRASLSMIGLPAIEGQDPLDTLRFVIDLNNRMRELYDRDTFNRYLAGSLDAPYRNRWHGIEIGIDRTHMITITDGLEQVPFLCATLKTHWATFKALGLKAAEQWQAFDELTRMYLLGRASDIITYGDDIANVTFPLPNVPSAAAMVSVLIQLFHHEKRHLIEEENNRRLNAIRVRLDKAREKIDKEGMEIAARIQYNPPVLLAAQVLSSDEIASLRDSCLNMLTQKTSEWDPGPTLHVLNEFVAFCTLLSQPENHIKVPSGQYVTKPINPRTYADMTNEVAQKMTKLGKFLAYAKIIDEGDGEVVSRTIRTPTPPELPDWCQRLEQAGLEDETTEGWNKRVQAVFAQRTQQEGLTKARIEIDAEITERRQRWKLVTGRVVLQPPSQSEVKRVTPPSDNPPPRYVSQAKSAPEDKKPSAQSVPPPRFVPVRAARTQETPPPPATQQKEKTS